MSARASGSTTSGQADKGEHQQAFRQAISRFATGVTVVTTTGPDGPAGMTASAVSSLSLEPLQLLVCIGTRLPTHDAVVDAGRFAVNVLAEGQGALAWQFARPSEDKFAGVALRDDQPVPVLRDSLAGFVCDVAARHPGGDHSIFVGRVTACWHDPAGRPLVYWGSTFGTLATDEQRLLGQWLDGVDLW